MAEQERNFHELIEVQWNVGKFLCIGLDPHPSQLPEKMLEITDVRERLVTWAQAIVHETAHVAAAYKPNTAFFEGYGHLGIAALEEICQMIRDIAPEAVIILDAKRGDIESTNEGTVTFAYDICGADAITVQPYVGGRALEPFLRRREKGVIILGRTSNAGADEFQHAILKGTDAPLYDFVAGSVADRWKQDFGNAPWLVVGATAPEECAKIRERCPELPFLIPGIGAQGGDLEKTIAAAKREDGKGFLISVSRAVLFASNGEDFAEAARAKAEEYHEEITKALNNQ